MRNLSGIIAPWVAMANLALVNAFVPPPQGVEIILSEKFPGAEISYKETNICETTEGVKSYSGYVTLPKEYIVDSEGWEDDEAAHIYFWYFESRSCPETAPTSIYLGGGPGASSLSFDSNYPCHVNQDSNSTTINEFSWNNNVNMLYVDQPIGTGFSYVSLLNGSMNMITQTFVAEDSESGEGGPELNLTTVAATLDQGWQQEDVVNQALLPRTTLGAARTMWKFAQVWFNEFPQRKTTNDEINLWTVLYGGFYGPAFFSHWLDQNELIASGHSPLVNATTLNLGTLGLSEPCMDSRALAMGYPLFARNNTYDIELYSDEVFEQVVETIQAPEEGCFALIDGCRALAAEGDPMSFGLNETVNEACATASMVCFGGVQGAVTNFTTRAAFDITFFDPTKFPVEHKYAFLNQRWVQEGLGVPLNYTSANPNVDSAFLFVTGDPMIRDSSALESVLKRGVNVAVVSGDRDYRCNWFGAEATTLGLDTPSSSAFGAAGYAPITTNSSYSGGLVREHGNLSFSRIFQAGHGVSAYQPETLYRLFHRALSGRDVATGEIDVAHNPSYATEGPLDITHIKNEVPVPEKNTCLFYQAMFTCTTEQLEALAAGTAVVENFVMVSPDGTREGDAKTGSEQAV